MFEAGSLVTDEGPIDGKGRNGRGHRPGEGLVNMESRNEFPRREFPRGWFAARGRRIATAPGDSRDTQLQSGSRRIELQFESSPV